MPRFAAQLDVSGHRLPGMRFYVGVLVTVPLVLSGCVGVSVDKVEPTIPASPSGSSQVGSAPDPALAKYYAQDVNWRRCSPSSSFLCGTINVPLDYAKPDGPAIKVAVLQVQSSGDARLGSLLMDPGGPGGSGIEFAAAAAGAFSPEIRDAYNLIGLDPRGVGQSTPVECLTDKQTDDLIDAPSSPENQAEEQEAIRVYTELGPRCVKNSPQIARYMDSISASKDMDVLRASLREDKLNYLGYSYGTFLGALYAEQFPTHVGRFVLDGALDPELDNAELATGQAAAFQVELGRYLDWCVQQRDCPLGSDRAAAEARLQAFVRQVADQPLAAEPSRPLTESLLISAMAMSMYAPEVQWDSLNRALAAGLAGDGSELLALVDETTERNANGTFNNNGNEAIYAVNCLDRPDRYDAAQVEKLAGQWGQQWPFIGDSQAWSLLACDNWPAPATYTPHKIVAPGTPDILVIGTQYDPATPYVWAQALAGGLENGKLISWQGGDGHTAYLRSSACVNAIVNRFLLTGKAPEAENTVCPLTGAIPISD
ncbi:MAG: hypothetical protein QG671_2445 [Actinomycetota bacterium]|nr:hypothetical protein [Actinomycetota bacterium]